METSPRRRSRAARRSSNRSAEAKPEGDRGDAEQQRPGNRAPLRWPQRIGLTGPGEVRVLAILACALALSAADAASVGATAPQLESSLDLGNTQIGVLTAVTLLVAALAAVPVGVLSDRVRRQQLLWVSIVLWGLAMFVSGASSSYLMLLLSRLALGAVSATAGPTIASLVGDFFPARQRAAIYGYILVGELVGAGFGLLVSGDLAALLTWRVPFFLLGGLGLALALAVARWLPEPPRGKQVGRPAHAEEPARDPRLRKVVENQGARPSRSLLLRGDPGRMSLPDAVRYVLSVRTNLVLIGASALGYFFLSGVRTFAVLYFRGRFDLSQPAATALLGVIGLGAVAGVVAGGRLADRLLDRGRATARVVVPAVCFLASAAFFVPGILTGSLPVAIALLLLAVLALAATNPPLDAARLDVMHYLLWGRAESVRTLCRTLLEAAAPILFGLVSDLLGGSRHARGLELAFLAMLAPLAFASLILVRGVATYPRDVATALASEARR